jgi:hypothetical protein
MSVMFGLVGRGPKEPNRAGHVDVAGAHHYQFARTHPGLQLKADHIGQYRAEDRQGVIDNRASHGQDWGTFPGLAPTALPRRDGTKRLVDRLWNQFVFDSPFEHPPDAFHPRVDLCSAERFLRAVFWMLITCHHQLTHRFERQRAELSSMRAAV